MKMLHMFNDIDEETEIHKSQITMKIQNISEKLLIFSVDDDMAGR